MCFETSTYDSLGVFFLWNVNTVVNSKEARGDDGHERMRGSGKEKRIVGDT